MNSSQRYGIAAIFALQFLLLLTHQTQYASAAGPDNGFLADTPGGYLVAESVVALYADIPDETGKKSAKSSLLQETQLLFGETVRLSEERGSWARIEALEQKEFSHNEMWEGYPGWVRRDALVEKPAGFRPNAIVAESYAPVYESTGAGKPAMDLPFCARVNVISQEAPWAKVRFPGRADAWVLLKYLQFIKDMPTDETVLRVTILRSAQKLLNQPYLEGGLSCRRLDGAGPPRGIDSAGLVYLCFGANGLGVPRDAHEQYISSTALQPQEMQPGDLFFLADKADRNKVVDVMLFLGGDHVLEASRDEQFVQAASLSSRVGKSLRNMTGTESVRGQFLRLGRLIEPSQPQ